MKQYVDELRSLERAASVHNPMPALERYSKESRGHKLEDLERFCTGLRWRKLLSDSIFASSGSLSSTPSRQMSGFSFGFVLTWVGTPVTMRGCSTKAN